MCCGEDHSGKDLVPEIVFKDKDLELFPKMELLECLKKETGKGE